MELLLLTRNAGMDLNDSFRMEVQLGRLAYMGQAVASTELRFDSKRKAWVQSTPTPRRVWAFPILALRPWTRYLDMAIGHAKPVAAGVLLTLTTIALTHWPQI